MKQLSTIKEFEKEFDENFLNRLLWVEGGKNKDWEEGYNEMVEATKLFLIEAKNFFHSYIKEVLKELKGIFDEHPKYGGLVNFASNAPEGKDITKAKIEAFNYGFKLGWQTRQFELNQKIEKLIGEEYSKELKKIG